MKKILLVALAAAAMVGCSQNEEIENAGQKAEIKFNTVVRNSTRATITGDADLQTSGFVVYAYNTGTEKMEGAGTAKLPDAAFISNDVVTYTSPNWAFTGGPYYWPLSGNIQFFAYASGDDNASGYTATAGSDSPTITYTVPEAASAQKDFVVATLFDKTKTTAVLPLTFNHALTQVNFSAKSDNTGFVYNVTSVKLVGISNSGTYNFRTGKWVAKTETANIKDYVYLNGGVEVTGGETNATDLMPTDGALMLIPQDMPTADDTKKIVLSYEVKKDDVSIGEVKDFEISLKGKNNWAAGNKIRYILNLTDKGATVSLSASVDEWGNETEMN